MKAKTKVYKLCLSFSVCVCVFVCACVCACVRACARAPLYNFKIVCDFDLHNGED